MKMTINMSVFYSGTPNNVKYSFFLFICVGIDDTIYNYMAIKMD